MATSEDFVRMALAQTGDRYVWATEASPFDPNPTRFDCSELVEWALARIHVRFPDGSFNQWDAVHRMSVGDAIRTRGALLFEGARSRVHHVAISLGDGTTIEARGTRWGVGTWAVSGRPFDGGGWIPGLTYVKPGTRPPVNQGGGVGIRPGSSSQAVRFLQQMLNVVRHSKGRSAIATDGAYGNATKAAVLEFQKDWESIAGFHRLIDINLAKNAQVADPDTLRAISIAVRLIVG